MSPRRSGSNTGTAGVSGFSALTRAGVVLLACVASTSALCAEPQSTTEISREVKEVFARCAKAVVKIRAVDEHSKVAGTGFFIDPAGTIYTAFSVGADADNFTVEIDGKEVPAH